MKQENKAKISLGSPTVSADETAARVLVSMKTNITPVPEQEAVNVSKMTKRSKVNISDAHIACFGSQETAIVDPSPIPPGRTNQT